MDVRRVQELRRSNAATAIPGRRWYDADDWREEIIDGQEQYAADQWEYENDEPDLWQDEYDRAQDRADNIAYGETTDAL